MSSNMVSQLTSYLRGLSRRRSSGYVTADDVQNFLSRKGFRGNQNQRLSITRTVLSAPEFTSVGSVPSKRDAARSRRITAWTTSSN